MHLEDRGNICKETALTLQYIRLVCRTVEGHFVSKILPKRYPNKHIKNVRDFGPPTLEQQALHHYLLQLKRSNGESSHQNKSKEYDIEDKDMDFLECDEEFNEE